MSPLGKYLRRLVGKNDLEDALKRPDKLTQEEARMETAEVLKVMHSVDDNVEVVIDGAQREFLPSDMLSFTVLIIYTTRRQGSKSDHATNGNQCR